MKIIENIKRNTGLKALSKSLRTVKRNKVVHNLVTARTIGIVGIVNSNNDFEEINSLHTYLLEKKMQVDFLLYCPGKEIPQQLIMRKGINIFGRKEVNWYGKPLIPFVEQFCKVEYDILIDLSLIELYPLRWISSLSCSKFKVGSLDYAGNPYDLTINVDSRREISYLSEQIIHYLNLLNNPDAQ